MVQRWIIPLLGAMANFACAFCPKASHHAPTTRRPRTAMNMASLDPNDVLHSHPHLEALFSTLYVQVLKPAHEHTQPLFGPPDPILSAGKSIMPSQNAFVESGLADIVKTAPLNLPDKVVDAMQKTPTKFVIDPQSILSFDDVLPGFQKTGHILPQHSESFPDETNQSLILEMGSIAKLMRVVNRLPMAAFLYACAEFFLVRPGYDVYKEELEDDGVADATLEFMTLSGIRLAILSAIGVLTLGLFDK